MSDALRRRLQAALERTAGPSSDYDLNAEVPYPEARNLREAAVLVPILDRSDGARIILTKRTSTLNHHPGQISFPGGKVDLEDSGVVAAALREAEEEIGLTGAEVLGQLPKHETVTGFVATPVVAIVPTAFSPVLSKDEVAEVFEVPFDHVMDTRNYSVQSRRWRGQRRSYFTVPWGPYYIWGATARMLRAMADLVSYGADQGRLAGKSTDPEHSDHT